MYTRDSNGVWGNERKIVAEDGARHSYFGWSVSVKGNLLAVGSRGDQSVARNAGASYVYRKNGDNWLQEAKLTVADGTIMTTLAKVFPWTAISF